MKNLLIVLNSERNVTLDCFIQDENNVITKKGIRPAILIFPGGAYTKHDLKEADNIAFAYLKAGFCAFVLRYSIGEHAVWKNLIEDYETAMNYLIQNGDSLNIDKDRIAVIGFSAGGHLVFHATVLSHIKPGAVILGYPAVNKELSSKILKDSSNALEVNDNHIPPFFLFHTRNDELVDVGNTLEIQNYLYKNNINFESHIYSFGAHGFSLGDQTCVREDISVRVKNWHDDSLTWLDEVWGKFGRMGCGKPKYTNRVNDDRLGFLTCECTMKRIMQNDEAGSYVREKIGEPHPMFENMKLSTVLAFVNKTDEIEEMNKVLCNYK